MKLLELHILQSYPVSCLNRDDLNSPKTAIFGGKQRARISSQCYKRAIRLRAQEILPSYFMGIRTKKELENVFLNEFTMMGLDHKDAANKAKDLIKKGILGKDTCVYIAPAEISGIAKAFLEDKPYDWKLSIDKAADIALFGRMLANETKANIEAASLFNHAISTHAVNNEIDFFTAIDDLSKEQGSAHMGMTEFNSAVYYRYAAINLDQLKKNLGDVTQETYASIIKAFCEATLLAVPHARETTMNAATLPSYAKIVCRNQGSPLQAINAFEKAITPKDGYMTPSIESLENHWSEMCEFFGIKPAIELTIPLKGTSLESVLNKVVEWSNQS